MARSRLEDLRFDPGPDCSAGCELTSDRYCDLSCMFVAPDIGGREFPRLEPLLWEGD